MNTTTSEHPTLELLDRAIEERRAWLETSRSWLAVKEAEVATLRLDRSRACDQLDSYLADRAALVKMTEEAAPTSTPQPEEPTLRFSQAGLASVEHDAAAPVRGHGKAVRLIDPAAIDVEALAVVLARADGWTGALTEHRYHGGKYLRHAEAVVAHLTGGAR